jgi:hypothetical protein
VENRVDVQAVVELVHPRYFSYGVTVVARRVLRKWGAVVEVPARAVVVASLGLDVPSPRG